MTAREMAEKLVLKHGGMKPAARACKVHFDVFKRILRGKTDRPRDSTIAKLAGAL